MEKEAKKLEDGELLYLILQFNQCVIQERMHGHDVDTSFRVSAWKKIMVGHMYEPDIDTLVNSIKELEEVL